VLLDDRATRLGSAQVARVLRVFLLDDGAIPIAKHFTHCYSFVFIFVEQATKGAAIRGKQAAARGLQPGIVVRLVDVSNSDESLMPLSDGIVLSLVTLPPKLTIEADPSSLEDGKSIETVEFSLTSGGSTYITNTESVSPYYLNGDKNFVNPKEAFFLPGSNTLAITVTFNDGSTVFRAIDFEVHSPVVWVDAGGPEEDYSLFSANRDKTYSTNTQIDTSQIAGHYPASLFGKHRWASRMTYHLEGLNAFALYTVTLVRAETAEF